MTITPISSSNQAAATELSAASQSQPEMRGLDHDAFIILLLAQLKSQDPHKPTEDKDSIVQLAQFNTPNQLTQMNKTPNKAMGTHPLAQGSALIGRMVSGLGSDGNIVSGLVAGLRTVGSKVMLDVNGREVPLDRINSVQV